MNTLTDNMVRALSIAFAALVLLTLPFAIAPKAHAADIDGGDTGYYFDSYTDSYPASYDYGYDTGYYFDSYTDSYPASYDYGYDYGYSDYSFGISMPLSYGGGYGGGYSVSYANTSVFAPTNTCTATNSCNTTTQINAPTTITNNTSGGGSYGYPVYQPVYVPQQPVYYPQQPIYHPPLAYNQPAPYVSLSAVPYTGLDLGPWGTAAYWGFLILWCLGAAYLIVVKRVQNKLVSGLNSFLFGSSARKATAVHAAHAPVVKHSAPASSPAFSGIDPFIASQISRPAF